MKRNPSLRLSAISLHLINIRAMNSIIVSLVYFSLISKKAVWERERKKRSQHKNKSKMSPEKQSYYK